MASTPTKNSVPSENYDDMRFNAGKLDEFVTSSNNQYTDRLGIVHLTARGLQNSVAGALLPENNLSDVQSADSSLSNLGAGAVGTAVFKSGTAPAARLAISAASSGANNDITSITGLTTALAVNQGGLGNTSARAATATKLDVPRGLRVNLASTNAVNFDGSADANPGVTGTLPLSNGGLGATTAAGARASIGAKSDAGVTDASSATAGQVGEVITNQATGVSLTSGSASNLTSVSLTAGDWDVSGVVSISNTGSNIVVSFGGLSTISGSLPSFPRLMRIETINGTTGLQNSVPSSRFNISAATTVYLVGQANSSAGTNTGSGYILARRIR